MFIHTFCPSPTLLIGFTCGFDTPVIAAIVGSPYIPATASVAAVAADHCIAPVAAIFHTTDIDAVASVSASTLTQHDLLGHFQPKLDNMDITIYNAFCKKRNFL